MKLELSNGYAEIKDVYTRGTAKKAQEILLQGVELSADGKDTKAKGFSMKSSEEANDFVMLAMVQKIVIGENELAPSIEVFDSLNNADYKKIKAAIDKIALGDEDPKK
jgi:hypothetical protein